MGRERTAVVLDAKPLWVEKHHPAILLTDDRADDGELNAHRVSAESAPPRSAVCDCACNRNGGLAASRRARR
jgi:hypothetical protein